MLFNEVFFYWSILILNWLALHCAVFIRLAYKPLNNIVIAVYKFILKFAFFHMQIDVWRKMIFFKKRVSLNRHFIAQDSTNCVLKLTKIVYGSVTIKFINEFRGCRDHPRESTLWQSWWPKKYQRCYPLVFQITNWNFHPNSTLPILLKNVSSRNFTVSSLKSHFPPSPIETLPTEKNLRTFFQ